MRDMTAAIKRRVPWQIRGALTGPRFPAASRSWLQGSFSQAGEDRIAAHVFTALRIERPTWLDLGAYHPFHLNNTALMYLAGGRGINVEADPDSFAAFPKYRRRDTNLNVGVGAEPGRLTFYRMTAPTLNTFSKTSADQAVDDSSGQFRIESTLDIEIQTVPDILRDSGGARPDFLSLDVEGVDVEILRTMSGWDWRPTVVCVETITYSEHGTGEKIPEIDNLLTGLGYLAYADTNINGIFVREDRWVRL